MARFPYKPDASKNESPISKKVRDLLKIEKSTCIVVDSEEGRSETWYLPNGDYHREHGPAIVNYYKNGQRGNVCYYINGKLHRDDGPAWVDYDEDGFVVEESWHSQGKLHRTDGPANVFHHNKDVSIYYFLNGIEYTKEDWEREVAKGNL
jgi:hypothetical protein